MKSATLTVKISILIQLIYSSAYPPLPASC
jgi:hypothetical protein